MRPDLDTTVPPRAGPSALPQHPECIESGRRKTMRTNDSLQPIIELLATSTDPAFVVDRDGRIVHWNAAATAFFGTSAEETLGRRCASVVRGSSPTGEIACTRPCPLLIQASHDDSYVVAELSVPTKPRPSRWHRVRVHHVPLEDDSGALSYLLHVITPARDGAP
jgi:PAS domain-containing protein